MQRFGDGRDSRRILVTTAQQQAYYQTETGRNRNGLPGVAADVMLGCVNHRLAAFANVVYGVQCTAQFQAHLCAVFRLLRQPAMHCP